MSQRIRFALSIGVVLLAGLGAFAPTFSWAQESEFPTEFASGDNQNPIYIYVSLYQQGSPSIVLSPGEGLSGAFMRTNYDGSPGWGDLLIQRGFNAFSLDMVGCGSAPRPSLDDYDYIIDRSVYGSYAAGLGALSKIYIAHGTSAAFALKARSWDPLVAQTMIFIDPIGPRGSIPPEDFGVADILAERENLEDLTWQRLGFGPRRGVLRDGIDIDLAMAEAVFANFEFDQPAFSISMLKNMDSATRIREPIKLAGLPVLVVRTPAADTAQIARETAFVEWMRAQDMRVETLDLGAMPEFSGVSGLPWIGDLAEPILDSFLEWYRSVYLAMPGS